MDRLADIGDQILAGTPIGQFDLTEIEVVFILGYTRQAVESYMGDADAEDEP